MNVLLVGQLSMDKHHQSLFQGLFSTPSGLCKSTRETWREFGDFKLWSSVGVWGESKNLAISKLKCKILCRNLEKHNQQA
jgi:hypothetical protein